ncbi:nucleotide sugar dehydrogenase [Roseivirga pacifica]|uniref:nucleotide sugar dehydrogenase n=1 Tax=Roseivirga pacifica TaxID=1267423 RepID=UPI0020945C7B|nr:nucleotide sugar dehydrogenase [Roseivirga pacifica]MCO6359472.1 nucleotide sugar dehydrogenase [Roseivirga pacifica]MCO6366842.1 nucleotide sugar dehydrogenase [Roseivirga pacifica]MCO6370626.1 nucleotide sugar dehydrogenase [Roseivirga pacifica]MCO6374498.1 nucleotide sugar dehydrogenase [Roseivirga pacifica]MCO6379757.1 nucleotide sugar dehydrogenase [Roseivirga pacifica]
MNDKIAIIGLGYVGLPLAVAFAEKYQVVGFDINEARIRELNAGNDHTLEVEDDLLKSVLSTKDASKGLFNSCDLEDIKDCNIFIVTVPTPIDNDSNPDLTPLIKASETVAKVLKAGDVVIYESTVYPGATEEDCVPVLEEKSGLVYNKDFFCGYSPERINPGDKEHTVTKILKVTSGSTPEIAERVDQLYKSVITAGTYKAASIKVAEAAKVIENSQRDINIAFVNELAMIFNKLNIDTVDVLEAAGTKWNFLPFRPGLVGGHCIGVDPYYLAQKAKKAGYYPQIVLSGRRLNNSIGPYVGSQVVKLLMKKGKVINDSKVLVCGITFKENCPDIRNSRVIDIVTELGEFEVKVDVYDPWANAEEVKHEYGIDLKEKISIGDYDGIVLAVAHNEFKEILNANALSSNQVIYDVKSILPKELVTARL